MNSELKTHFILAIVFFAVFTTGLHGLYQTSFWNSSFSNNLYLILGLFAMSGEWTVELSSIEPLPLSLQASRFLAPLTTVAALFILILDNAKRTLRHWLRPRTSHTIIVGKGSLANHLSQTARKSGRPTIQISWGSGAIESRTLSNGLIYQTDFLAHSLLKKLRLHYASELIICSELDSDNLAAIEGISEFLTLFPPVNVKLSVFVHLSDKRLNQKLADHAELINPVGLNIQYWNRGQLMAEALFEKFPPERYCNLKGKPTSDLLIIGDDQYLDEIGTQLLLRGSPESSNYPKVTFVPLDSYRSARNSCAIPDSLWEFTTTEPLNGAIEFENELLTPILRHCTQVIVCGLNEVDSLNLAINLHKIQLSNALFSAPIIKVDTSHNFESNQRRMNNLGSASNLYELDLWAWEASYTKLVRREAADLAFKLHQNAYKRAKPGTAIPWENLPFSLKESNRLLANSWPTKLSSLNLAFVENISDSVKLTSQELEDLAEIEHTRWKNERLVFGWTHHSIRSNILKHHPLLKPWNQLADNERYNNVRYIESSYLELIDSLNQPRSNSYENRTGIGRIRTIGVTGHRWFQLDKKDELKLVKEIDQTLNRLRKCYPDSKFRLITALAEGADRLVAERAIKLLDIEIIALLPMPYIFYKLDFNNSSLCQGESSESQFLRILSLCDWYCEIPPTYSNPKNLEDLTHPDRAKQYASLGNYIASMADDLVAIWNRQPSKGPGGTADVISSWKRLKNSNDSEEIKLPEPENMKNNLIIIDSPS